MPAEKPGSPAPGAPQLPSLPAQPRAVHSLYPVVPSRTSCRDTTLGSPEGTLLPEQGSHPALPVAGGRWLWVTQAAAKRRCACGLRSPGLLRWPQAELVAVLSATGWPPQGSGTGGSPSTAPVLHSDPGHEFSPAPRRSAASGRATERFCGAEPGSWHAPRCHGRLLPAGHQWDTPAGAARGAAPVPLPQAPGQTLLGRDRAARASPRGQRGSGSHLLPPALTTASRRGHGHPAAPLGGDKPD